MNVFTSMKYKENKAPLIWRLNLRISGCEYKRRKIGWIFFFSQSENKSQLMQLDAFVRNQASKVLSQDQLDKLKTFVKAYHEVRHNRMNSKYFPNFDSFDDIQKRVQIGMLMPHLKKSKLNSLGSEKLTRLFQKCISREISVLEKDMFEVFS